MVAPHRRNRKRPKIQDGRKLRRYKRRWKVERLFAWLGNSRRVVRYEQRAENYLTFARLGCIVILEAISQHPLGNTESKTRDKLSSKRRKTVTHGSYKLLETLR